MTKLLIIGSKGFIGSHSLDYFSTQEEMEVWGCDIVVDYALENYFILHPTNTSFDQIFEKNDFDVCLNCSGAAVVSDSIKNPSRDYILNAGNVFRILDSIRKYRPACKFINLSSAAVYGNPIELPIKENSPCNPVSPYGFHKKTSELLCEEFSKIFNLKTCGLRIFSAYGEGLKKQLFWDLYKKSKTDLNLDLFGTGNESRDFIHVSDIVQAIDVVIKNCKFEADVLNVANGEEIYIKDAASTFFKAIAYQGKHSFSQVERKGDPSNWVADITRLKSLGYTQKVNFEEGIKKYVEWLRELE